MRKAKFIDLIRLIKTTPVTFMLIAIMVTLSVATYAGLQFSAKAIMEMGDRYYTAHDFHDMHIISTIPFSEQDVKDIAAMEGFLDAQGYRSVDTYVAHDETMAIAHVFSDTPGINTPTVLRGRMPAASGECVLEFQYAEENGIEVGDVIGVDSDKLAVKQMTVTGIVETPLLVTKVGQYMHGNSSSGDGEILLYVILYEGDFLEDAFFGGYSGIYASFEKDERTYGYQSKEYLEFYNKQHRKVLSLSETNATARYEQLLQEYQMLEGRIRNTGWRVTASDSNVGFLRFQQSMVSLDSIAIVVSAVFILVSIVVCYSVILGMVNDEKSLIGMQKALGFRNREIYMKYICYSVCAVFVGTLLGTVLGVFVVERITYTAVLGHSYVFNDVRLVCSIPVILAMIVVMCVFLVVSTVMACRQIVQKPAHILVSGSDAQLVKPMALEKLKFFKRAPLDLRIVLRNIFVEKKSFLTVLICVVGCMILMCTPMCIRDGMAKSPHMQYDIMQTCDKVITFSESATDEEKAAMLEELDKLRLEKKEILANYVLTFLNGERYMAFELTAGDAESIAAVYELLDIDNKNKKMTLPSEGILISRKIREEFGFDTGDKITVTATNGLDYEFTIAGVFEFYIGHKMLCTPEYYEAVTGSKIADTCIYVDARQYTKEELTNRLASVDSFKFITDTKEQGEFLMDVAKVTDSIAALAIVFALILSLSVLINLAFMNVRGKNNEIAVMRLLGFMKGRVFFYTIRESILATILGILLSYPFIKVIGRYATFLAEIHNYQYVKEVPLERYLMTAGIAIGFTAFVNLFTVKRINEITVHSIKR